MGLGWAGCRAMAGASSLPHSDWEQLGQLCPLTRERRQCRCPVLTTPLAASHSPRARSGAGGTGQAPEGAGSRLLRAGWHDRPGTEQQALPTARQGTPAASTPLRGGTGVPSTVGWELPGHGTASPPPGTSAGIPEL